MKSSSSPLAASITKNPIEMPMRYGSVFRNPCCIPEDDADALFGPGVNVVAIAYEMKGIRSSGWAIVSILYKLKEPVWIFYAGEEERVGGDGAARFATVFLFENLFNPYWFLASPPHFQQ